MNNNLLQLYLESKGEEPKNRKAQYKLGNLLGFLFSDYKQLANHIIDATADYENENINGYIDFLYAVAYEYENNEEFVQELKSNKAAYLFDKDLLDECFSHAIRNLITALSYIVVYLDDHLDEDKALIYFLAFEKYSLEHDKVEIDDRGGQKKRIVLTYNWLTKPALYIPQLFELVKMNGLVDGKTSYNDFYAVFSAKQPGSFKPIRWHENNVTELLYFLKRLMQGSTFIKNEYNRLSIQRLKACFKKTDGSDFTQKISAIKNQVDLLSTDKQKVIDRAIEQLKTL